jgi:hypothetical protein
MRTRLQDVCYGLRMVAGKASPFRGAGVTICRTEEAAERLPQAVILRSRRRRRISHRLENTQSEILRAVYPERQSEILRFAQNDSEGLRMTLLEARQRRVVLQLCGFCT